jgi:predicted nucleic acid-binding protein
MAQRVSRLPSLPADYLVLDADPLSRLADRDEQMLALLKVAKEEGYAPALSAVSITEVRRTGRAAQQLAFQLSRMKIVPATEQIAISAAGLLEDCGLDGHTNVVDALVVATAAAFPGRVKVASTDRSHIPKLCRAASDSRAHPLTLIRT